MAKYIKVGQRKHPLYSTYWRMRDRCYYPGSGSYSGHGGRGITVCERWLGEKGFFNFIADMGDKPSPRHTLERIDNDGDYTPENCKWATQQEQIHNRRINRNNKSGFPGVCFATHRGLWTAQLRTKDRHYTFGYYDTLEEAISARLTGEAIYGVIPNKQQGIL